jgi:replicative DNA helicase
VTASELDLVAPPQTASRTTGRPVAIADVLVEAERASRSGVSSSQVVHPTGFTPLDEYLGGGLRGGELCLVGGPQGLGKTVLALQMARNVVAAGGQATYVSYEHDNELVLERLLAMEAGLAHGMEGPTLDEVRRAMSGRGEPASLDERLGPSGGTVVDTVRAYGDRLRVVRASGSRTGVEELRALVREGGDNALLVVDYLQKVNAAHIPGGEDERVTHVVESLKDLALDTGCPVLAIVAADKAGLAGARTRLHHLRGSTALAYEADVALLLNDKFDIVARHHLVYGTTDADRFRNWVVCSIEKNRSGVAGVDLEFEKDFTHARFLPRGRVVAEVLADPRLGHE